MQIDIVTVAYELLDSPFSHSIMKRAQDNRKVAREFYLSKRTTTLQALIDQ